MLREDILFKGGTLGSKTLRSKLPKPHCIFSLVYDQTGNPIGYEKYEFRRAGPMYVFNLVEEQRTAFEVRQVPVVGTIGCDGNGQKEVTERLEGGEPEQEQSKSVAGSEQPASARFGRKKSVRNKGMQK